MGDNVIEAHGLTKYFGSEKVVDTLKLAVQRGLTFWPWACSIFG